jgi:hypothetical protein
MMPEIQYSQAGDCCVDGPIIPLLTEELFDTVFSLQSMPKL